MQYTRGGWRQCGRAREHAATGAVFEQAQLDFPGASLDALFSPGRLTSACLAAGWVLHGVGFGLVWWGTRAAQRQISGATRGAHDRPLPGPSLQRREMFSFGGATVVRAGAATCCLEKGDVL